jgi:DNA-binding transcriptional LysR family regulator
MDLKLLRYFTVLAEEQHFGRAAKRLALSQPPLSLAIRRLEAELGTLLFVRTSRLVSLTRAGEVLQREAQAILHRAESARTLVRDVAQGSRGRLLVGFSGSMIYRGLPQLVAALRERLPNVELDLREMNSAEQAEALRLGELGVGFINGRFMPAGLNGFRYQVEPFALCTPAAHPAAARDRVDAADILRLQHEPFLLFSRQVSPDYYESVIAICLEAGFLPKVRFELRHWLTVVAMVASGSGVALVPACLAHSGLPGVAFQPLMPFSKIRSETWCVWGAGSEDALRDTFTTAAREAAEANAPSDGIGNLGGPGR